MSHIYNVDNNGKIYSVIYRLAENWCVFYKPDDLCVYYSINYLYIAHYKENLCVRRRRCDYEIVGENTDLDLKTFRQLMMKLLYMHNKN